MTEGLLVNRTGEIDKKTLYLQLPRIVRSARDEMRVNFAENIQSIAFLEFADVLTGNHNEGTGQTSAENINNQLALTKNVHAAGLGPNTLHAISERLKVKASDWPALRHIRVS